MLIREKDRQAIIELARKTIKQPATLWAFGSRVNGDAHDTSDLDLVLVSKEGQKIDIDAFIDFKESLRDSNIPIITQVLDWNRIPESFHQNILKKYEEVVTITE
jgi:predicted nucleotidyltransferase